ncbi:probable calcium-binding protein CML29 [Rhodamnia argentea]|uniref:Probable calcium-binding protein CML29 n=1 Tax=Rhodamnia argentea TaxID=178133 RepID=A0A8B8QDL7_9MYRT|nr:probable calcium-binding protein CML29 [Rhodamnia argentea]
MAHSENETLNQVLALVEAFRAFDSDDDGQITAVELGGIMRSLGYNVSAQEVDAMMGEADANRDGMLSVAEFLEMTTKDMDLGELASFLGTTLIPSMVGADGEVAVEVEDLRLIVQCLL